MFRKAFFVTLFFTLATSAYSDCGTSSCPLDTHALNTPRRGEVTLDLSFQYFEQDQLRFGDQRVKRGEISSSHDEILTTNNITTAMLQYAPSDRWKLSSALPFVSRSHLHYASNHAHGHKAGAQHNVIAQEWNVAGLGDVSLQARYRVARLGATALWAIGGVKLPTGETGFRNDEGLVAETALQPGSGSTDFVAGAAGEGELVVPTLFSRSFTTLPYAFTATYNLRGEGDDGREFGDELQLNASTAYSLAHRLDVLMQLNYRRIDADEQGAHAHAEGGSGVDTALSSGEFAYVTPGLRFDLGHNAAIYTLIQLPVHQRVDGVQLTSRQNFVVGVQSRF